jgi:hypothetical protein
MSWIAATAARAAVGTEECSRRGSNKRMGTTWAEGRMGAIVSMSNNGSEFDCQKAKRLGVRHE